jgi:hypothetical protein
MKQGNSFTRRQLILSAGVGVLPSWVAAQSHDHEAHHSGNPYGMLAKGVCEQTGLSCAACATPWFAADGKLWLCWNAEGAVWIAHSEDLGAHFSQPVALARHDAYLDIGPDARPQLVSNARGEFLIAYGYFHDDNWNARVNLVTSRDGGLSFSAPRALSQDSASQRFPSLAVNDEGDFLLAWVDKRWVAEDAKKGIKREGASIAWAWSKDGGQTFDAQQLAWENTCECCRIALAMSEQQLPVLMYRSLFEGSVRDHATQRFESAQHLAPPQRVSDDHWMTHACPHHGPALAVSSAGTYHSAWFTQGSVRNGVFYARSTDLGLHYSAPMRLGPEGKLVGRPHVLAVDQKIWLTWKEFDGHQASIGVRYSSNDGKNWSEPRIVATSHGYSDHPLLISMSDQAYLSWLTRDEGYRLIQLKEIV